MITIAITKLNNFVEDNDIYKDDEIIYHITRLRKGQKNKNKKRKKGKKEKNVAT